MSSLTFSLLHVWRIKGNTSKMLLMVLKIIIFFCFFDKLFSFSIYKLSIQLSWDFLLFRIRTFTCMTAQNTLHSIIIVLSLNRLFRLWVWRVGERESCRSWPRDHAHQLANLSSRLVEATFSVIVISLWAFTASLCLSLTCVYHLIV